MRLFVLLVPLMILGFSCSTKTTWYFYENHLNSGVKERGYAKGKVRWHIHKFVRYTEFRAEVADRYLCQRKIGLWVYYSAEGDTLEKKLYKRKERCEPVKPYRPKRKKKKMPKGFME